MKADLTAAMTVDSMVQWTVGQRVDKKVDLKVLTLEDWMVGQKVG